MASVHTPRALVREVSHETFNEGIEPGVSVELARRICPGLRLVPPDSSRLWTAHRELHRTILPLAPAWESIRPGSLFLDLTGTTRLFGPPIDTAARLGRELIERQGWNSVIGLAGNKLVSQLAATTLERPPQVFSIHPGSEQPFLAPLPTTVLPGLDRAQASQVLTLVLRQGIRPVFGGLLVGVAAALAAGRLIGSFLFGTQARDPAAISAVAAILLLVAAAACWAPARRASQIDPMSALRNE